MNRPKLKCRTCSEPATLQVDDENTASLLCASGHRQYFFKRDNGKWETQEARQKRLNKYRICGSCNREYMTSDHKASHVQLATELGLCPGCMTPVLKARAQRGIALQKIARDNPNSPWRKWLNKAKPRIQARV